MLINAGLLAAFDQALEFRKSRTVPSNWKTELKEESSSSEAEEEEEDEKEKEDNSSEEEASMTLQTVCFHQLYIGTLLELTSTDFHAPCIFNTRVFLR